MKSYIYIVITKELFRQSIVGQRRRGLGGVSLTSPAEPPGAGLLWDYVPPRQLPGAAGADALCLGAEPGTAQAPEPASCIPVAPVPPAGTALRSPAQHRRPAMNLMGWWLLGNLCPEWAGARVLLPTKAPC